MISNRSNEIEIVINNLNNYFAGDRESKFSDLVAEFDEVISKPSSISYLEFHPEVVNAIQEVKTKIVDVFVNTLTDMADLQYKKIDFKRLTAENIDQLTGGLISVYNAVSDYIRYTILLTDNKEQRDSLMERYFLIAKNLMDNGNYAIAESMFMSFNQADISRLYLVHDVIRGLSSQAAEIFAEMKELFDIGNRLNLFSRIAEQKGSKLPPVVKYTTKFEGLSGTIGSINVRKEGFQENAKRFAQLGDANDERFDERCQRLAQTLNNIIKGYQNKLRDVTDPSQREKIEAQIDEVQKNLNDLNTVIQYTTALEKNRMLADIKNNFEEKIKTENQNIQTSIEDTIKFTKGEFEKFYHPYTESNINENMISSDLANDLFNREDILVLNQGNFIIGKLSARSVSTENKIAFLTDETTDEAMRKILDDHLKFIKDLNDKLKEESNSSHGLLDSYVRYLETKRIGDDLRQEIIATRDELKNVIEIIKKIHTPVVTANLYDLSKHYRYDQQTDVRKSRLHKKIPKIFIPREGDLSKKSVSKTISHSKPVRAMRSKTFSGMTRMKAKLGNKQPKKVGFESENDIREYIKELQERGDKLSGNRIRALSNILDTVRSYATNIEKLKYLDKVNNDLHKMIDVKEDATESEFSSLAEHHAASTKRNKETSAIKLLRNYSNEIASAVVAEIKNGEERADLLTQKLDDLFPAKIVDESPSINIARNANTKIKPDLFDIEEPTFSPANDPLIMLPKEFTPGQELRFGLDETIAESDENVKPKLSKPLPPTPSTPPFKRKMKPLPIISETIHKQILAHQKELTAFEENLSNSEYMDNPEPMKKIIDALNHIYRDLLEANSVHEIKLLQKRLNKVKEFYDENFDITLGSPVIDQQLSGMERLMAHKEKYLSSTLTLKDKPHMAQHKAMLEAHWKTVSDSHEKDLINQFVNIYSSMMKDPSDENIQSSRLQFESLKKYYQNNYQNQAMDHHFKLLENDLGIHAPEPSTMFNGRKGVEQRNRRKDIQRETLRDRVASTVGVAIEEVGKGIKKFGSSLINKLKDKL